MALNIQTLKTEFEVMTGLEWKANIHAFIQYYQARVLEAMMDQQLALMEELIEKVSQLDH